MEPKRTPTHPNPRETTNVIAVLVWAWMVKFFKTGYTKTLEKADLYDPLKADRSEDLGDKLERYWNTELANSKKHTRSPSLLRALFRCFWGEFLVLGVVQISGEVGLRLGIPQLIGQLLRYFREEAEVSYTDALIYACAVCLATGVYAIVTNYWFYQAFHLGGRIRIAICSLMYRKALRLNMRALGDTTPGKIINLLANDVNRFDLVVFFIHYLWSAPLAGLIVGYFLWSEAGYGGLIGIAVILLCIPIQSYIGKLSAKFRLQTTVHTDERVRLMNEIISGVQVIKMYAWEIPFCKTIALIRKLELKQIRNNMWISGMFMAMFIFLPRLALYCTLVSMILFGLHPSTETVFIFFAYLAVMADILGYMLARGISEVAQCHVTIQRLQKFLMTEEFQTSRNYCMSVNSFKSKRVSKVGIVNMDDVPRIVDSQNGTVISIKQLMNSKEYIIEDEDILHENQRKIAIDFVNLTAKWLESAPESTLVNVNVELKQGRMYVIIGTVGSGKSSLISAILGEISILEGYIDIRGSISFASQEAWIFGGTVRQNILFGEPYDPQRYQEVVRVCALLSDFAQFPQGDQTIVGERGSSLSGGQKARINLARSVYRQSDIYIFDDPLSAVDTQVSKHLFEECFQKYLQGKTRILMTHQLQYVHRADRILVLDHGKLEIFRNYDDLLATRAEYLDLLTSSEKSDDNNCSDNDNNVTKRRPSGTESNECYDSILEDNSYDEEESDGLEKTSKGSVKGSIFLQYLTVGNSWCLIFTVIFLLIATQCAISFSDMFFPRMVAAEEKRHAEYIANLANSSNSSTILEEYSIEPTYIWVYVYTGITLAIIILSTVQSLIFFVTCVQSNQHLHDKAFSALVRTGMQFFSANPSGRILNRFSKDLDAMDTLLPKTLDDASVIIVMGVGVAVVICIINPIFLVPLVIIVFLFYWLTKIYIRTSKNVKRLEGMLRSPVFTHMNVTMNGLMTIRAFNVQETLKVQFDQFQNDHSSAWYMYITTSNAFSFSLDFCCFLLTVIVTFGLLLASGYTGPEVGLAITTIISMTTMLQWGVRQAAEVVNYTMSIERVMEYTLLPPEPNSSTESVKSNPQTKGVNNKACESLTTVPENWPAEGRITFKHVSLTYTEDGPAVLKDISFVISPRKKVGIVGRTGAGKSSLISAVFRLAKVEGIIEIDGVDTATISLQELRKNIAIIPQDPVLFSGTLRENLDPFNQFSDHALWTALEQVELKYAIIRGTTGLDSKVVDKGMNFSVGQRQLVCLARAILRNNRILVLDEATANVDPHTDMLIQRTIRTKFTACTVLTVAHRLNTIMDCEKVLVMDDGRMMEFDHPYILLQNSCGKFASLVEKAGESMSDNLFRIAKEAYKAKY